MTFYERCLGGYVPQDITLPVIYDGKPVGLLLDGGHGLRDFTSGKCAPDGSLYEGEWNREMVARLLPDCRAIGFDARCLVPEDEDTHISTRAARANKIMADEPDKAWFYLAVHINAAPKESCDKNGWCKKASGVCAYAPKNGTYKLGSALDDSRSMAKTFVDLGRGDFDLAGNRSLPKVGYWEANYTVIYKTKMPAILTESLFMTNPDEVEFLLSEKGKETISSWHIAALCKYFGVPYAHVIG